MKTSLVIMAAGLGSRYGGNKQVDGVGAYQTMYDALQTLPAEGKAECLLPIMVDDLIRSGRPEVSVLRSTDQWFGMPYQEDRAAVTEALRKLHHAGVYPDSLRA